MGPSPSVEGLPLLALAKPGVSLAPILGNSSGPPSSGVSAPPLAFGDCRELGDLQNSAIHQLSCPKHVSSFPGPRHTHTKICGYMARLQSHSNEWDSTILLDIFKVH